MERNGNNGQTLQGTEIDAAINALKANNQKELVEPLLSKVSTIQQTIYGTGHRSWAEAVTRAFGITVEELAELRIDVEYQRRDGTSAGDGARIFDELPMSEFETTIVMNALGQVSKDRRDLVDTEDLLVIDSLVEQFEAQKVEP